MANQTDKNPPTKATAVRLHEHPCFRKANELRESSQRISRWFLLALWLTLGASIGAYVSFHLVGTSVARDFVPRSLTNVVARLRTDPVRPVQLDSAGRVVYLSEADLRWYRGRDQTAALVAGLKERTQRITELEDKVVQQALLEFQVRFGSAGGLKDDLDNVTRQARTGNFAAASALLTDIVKGWSDETRKRVGEKAIFDLNYGLGELARLQAQQTNSLGLNLEPPRMHRIFWSTPPGALLEAVFWSLFGTLVNLVVNISQARAQGRFRSDEIWVSISKIIYGPILSLVLILSIYFGLLDAGTEIRFWFLPLAGFLFGYNTRKTAMVIDQLSEKLLGTASKSIRQSFQWQAQAADRAAAAVRAESTPRSLSELKEQVTAVADSATVAAVIKHQSKT